MTHAVSPKKKILAVLLGCMVAVLLAEIVLQFHNPFGTRLKGDKIKLPVHRRVIIENNQNPKLRSTIHRSYNSLGFRGEDPPRNFDDAITLIAIGGSTTECYYLTDGATWPEKLGRELKTHFEDIWVNNAGLDGHSTYGHKILIDDLIKHLKPDYALFLVGINDIERDDLSSYDQSQIQPENERNSLESRLKRFLSHSELFSCIRNYQRYRRARKHGLTHRALDLNRIDELKLPEEYIQETKKRQSRFLLNYRNRVEALITSCRTLSIEPILATQPVLWGECTDPITKRHLGNIRVTDNKNGGLYHLVLELYNDELRTIASTQNVFLIDLAEKVPKSSDLYYDGLHFTELGASKVAKIVADDLIPFLAESHNDKQKKTSETLRK